MEDRLRAIFRLDVLEKDKAYRSLVDEAVRSVDTKSILSIVDHGSVACILPSSVVILR